MSLVKGFSRRILTSELFQGMNQINDTVVDCFNTNRPYPIRLDWYVEHLLDQLNLPDEILVYTYILVDKYLNSGLLCQFNLHKIVFTSLITSLKFVLNPWISNKTLEKVGGIKEGTLSNMEHSLLHFINWKFEYKRFKEIHALLESYKTIQSSSEEDNESEDFICNDENESGTFSELKDFFTVEVLEN